MLIYGRLCCSPAVVNICAKIHVQVYTFKGTCNQLFEDMFIAIRAYSATHTCT